MRYIQLFRRRFTSCISSRLAMADSGVPLILRILSASVKTANHAGDIVRNIMKGGQLGIVEKGLNDLQTEADRTAQRCIVASLQQQFPKITIIGEETLDEAEVKDDLVEKGFDPEVLKVSCPSNLTDAKESDIVVWVDPLDGTAEYTQGLLDHVTVLIGVAVGTEAVGGVIHQPFYNYQNVKPGEVDNLGRTIWGLIGLGAFGFKPIAPPSDQRILTTTRSHATPVVQKAIDALEPDNILRVGGAGHKVLLLLEGKAHAYVFASKGCKKWDTCAPEAVLHAVGGLLTDIHGQKYQYHSTVKHMNAGGVLATYSSSVHDWYCNRIPQELKDTLH